MSMADYSQVILIGRLTKDPELRYTPAGVPVADFSVAVNRGDNKKADFFDVTAWRQAAEFVSEFLSKGRLVVVQGRPEWDEWEGQDGRKNRRLKVQASVVRALDPKPNGNAKADLPPGAEADVTGTPEEAALLF